ncbi:unnamed protein product [Rhizopus stolonifer]
MNISFWLTLAFLFQSVFGYCVINTGQTSSLGISQLSLNAGLDKWSTVLYYNDYIPAGESACCDFKDKNCCKSQKEDDLIKFILYAFDKLGRRLSGVDMTLPCDGKLNINGDQAGKLDYKAYYSNGNEFQPTVYDRTAQ